MLVGVVFLLLTILNVCAVLIGGTIDLVLTPDLSVCLDRTGRCIISGPRIIDSETYAL